MMMKFYWKYCQPRVLRHSLLSLKRSLSLGSIHQKGNVILMGSPGSGKTTVGRILAKSLCKPCIDIDDDYLERVWQMSVAKKLDEVGEDGFVEAEGRAMITFDANDSVVSLTGSNPMYKPAVDRIKSLGTVVFLDVDLHDIIARLERMKVNRIVGQKGDNSNMESLLKYRQQFYVNNYDIRVVCGLDETPESIAQRIVYKLNSVTNGTNFVSTRSRDTQEDVTFSDVVLQGLASDGGLYVVGDKFPTFSMDKWERLVLASYQQRALCILEKWITPTDIHPSLLSDMVCKAYDQRHYQNEELFPVYHIGRNQFLLEMFNGPTASFKDAALQLMPQLFVHALKQRDPKHKYLIVTATSGDTGSAVLDGFSKYAGDSNVGVIVLFPEDGISKIQKQQMTATTGHNLKVIGVKSDFDFCQTTIKSIFSDDIFRERLISDHSCKLSAANSINWGRLLPQVVYHASSYLDLVRRRVISCGDEIDVCIPTGNFGNITGAFYAKEMGIPIRRMIIASNSNNVLTEFFRTGVYDLRKRQLLKTASPAIDILKSSNLERYLFHKSGNDAQFVRKLYESLDSKGFFDIGQELLAEISRDISADWCSESDCLNTIRQVHKDTGYLLDPHTAVAKTVADRFNSDNCFTIISSTAHPAKFADRVLPAVIPELDFTRSEPADLFAAMNGLKSEPPMHTQLEQLAVRDKIHKTVLPPNIGDIMDEIEWFAKTL